MASRGRPWLGGECIRHVGIREFRDHAAALLSGTQSIVVEKHGKPVGFYIPVPDQDKATLYRSLDRLERAVEAALAQSGMTEDELAEAFTVRRDKPGDGEAPPAPTAPGR